MLRCYGWLAAVLMSLGVQASETVKVVGSSTVLPIAAQAAKAFHTDHPEVRITVSGGGSGLGIAAMAKGQADIGMSSRPPSDQERQRLGGIAWVTVARDAVAIAVSKAVAAGGVESLSVDELAAIYRGEIRNWQAVGGPDAEILVIDKEASRGTRQVFAEAILGHRHARAPGANLVAGANNEEQALIANSNQAIGMLSKAWLNDAVRGVPIRTQTGLAYPRAQDIAAERYSIARDLWLLIPEEASNAAQAFVDFILSPAGQEVVQDVGYLPVR